MKTQQNVQKFLQRKLEEIKKNNPKYSLRAFATKLGVTPGTLSQVLLGKRKISEKLAYKIADALKLSPAEKAEFLYQILETKRIQTYDVIPYKKINAETFSKVNDLRYWGILNLATTSDFHSDPEWIAERLGLETEEVERALKVLLDLNFLADDNGRLKRTTGRYIVDEDLNEAGWKKNNQDHLKLADKLIKEGDEALLDFSTISFPIDMNRFKEAQAMIRKFQEELQSLCSSGKTTEVYRLGIQLCPLTKVRKK